MGADGATAQHLATACLNLAIAVVTGACLTQVWLSRQTPTAWTRDRFAALRRWARVSAVVALAANFVVLWLEAAAMAEVPVTQAGPAVRTMLLSTHLGWAWQIGAAGLVAASAAVYLQRAGNRWPPLAALAGLMVFWYTRSMASHAASDGDLSLRLLADWAHLALISTWVGEVVVAGFVMLRPLDSLKTGDRPMRAAYVASLSTSATVALAGIFVTGLYAAWRSLDGLANLLGTPYGLTLVAKLICVGLAAALGGTNRLLVMPRWLAAERAGATAPSDLPLRFRRILWLEALVLVAAIALAAWLAATSPPGDQM